MLPIVITNYIINNNYLMADPCSNKTKNVNALKWHDILVYQQKGHSV